MNVKVNQTLRIAGKTYHIGHHAIPDDVVKHPHFEGYMKSGYITHVDAQPKSIPTAAELHQAVAKKMVADQEALKEKMDAPELPVSKVKKGK